MKISFDIKAIYNKYLIFSNIFLKLLFESKFLNPGCHNLASIILLYS
jgi:hypothetical protein